MILNSQGEKIIPTSEFVVGQQIVTTPQYRKLFGTEKTGKIIDIRNVGNGTELITFLCDGGKEIMNGAWLIKGGG